MSASTSAVGSPLTVLVAEHASASLPWLESRAPGHLSSLPGQMVPDVIVVSQLASESAAVFASRVMHRLARLDATRRTVTRAVLACGPRADEASLVARAQGAQALFACLERSPAASLTLAAARGAEPRLRHQLMAIAGALVEHAQKSGPDIRVQFGAPVAQPAQARDQAAADVSQKVA